MTVPDRQNQIVNSNTDLFHETGTPRFEDGFVKRRITFTMLYGNRGDH